MPVTAAIEIRELYVNFGQMAERIEARAAKAKRDLDRAFAAEAELSRQLAEAEAAEARSALTAERDVVAARAKRLTAKLVTEYVKAASLIAALLDELATVETAVSDVNAKLDAAGRPDDMLPRVEEAVVPSTSSGARIRLGTASLPPVPGFGGLGWGRVEAERYGII